MRDKNVSIVIPTFNRKDYLRKAIDTALTQTYECEVIVCDHGSTDGTIDVAKSYGSKIKYIRREKDYGVHFTWLDGIIHSSGDYIHINFDDDWIAPTFIEETMELFHEDVAFVFTEAEVVHENDKVRNVPVFNNLFQSGLHYSKKLEKILLWPKCMISPGCGIYRKSDLIDNLFLENIPGSSYHYKGVGPDLLFSLMPLLKYKKFGFINKPLAYFRAHEASITTNAHSNMIKSKKITQAYNDARRFYLQIKFFQYTMLDKILFGLHHYVILPPYRVVEKIKSLKGNQH